MMEKKWHYMQGEQAVGPFSEQQIVSMIESGTISANVLVWHEGGETWRTAKDTFDLKDIMPPPLPGKKFLNFSSVNNGFLQIKQGWITSHPHPWRRYFARLLDILIFGTTAFAALGVLLYSITPDFADRLFTSMEAPSGGALLDIVLTTFFASVLSAVCIGFTGRTIGKWFFGIKVTDPQNRPIGFKKAWKRELMVWARGLGLGIPIVSLFTTYSGYKNLMMHGQTTWDDELNLTVSYKPNSLIQISSGLIGFLILVVMIGILQSL